MIVNSSRFNFAELVEKYMTNTLQMYKDGVLETMEKTIDEVAKEAARKLKNESPKGATGKYAKGWAMKRDKGRLKYGVIVYGKDGTYQLAHLLEKGHANRGGGRTGPIEHIAPVEEWAIDEAENRFINKMENYYY